MLEFQDGALEAIEEHHKQVPNPSPNMQNFLRIKIHVAFETEIHVVN